MCQVSGFWITSSRCGSFSLTILYEIHRMKASVTLAIILNFFFNFDCLLSCKCKSHDGSDVNWFIMYKVPYQKDVLKGTEFFYMDARFKEWSYMNNTSIINKNETANPLYRTLQPIYNKTVSSFAIYNDQPPKKSKGDKWISASSTKGHSKGVVAFGDKSGFWIVSSVPRFPELVSKGYHYYDPQTMKGQTVFCFTSKNIKKEIGNIFDVINPHIYDEKNFDMYIPKRKKNSSVVPQVYKIINRIRIFAKFRNFRKDIYEDIISPELEAELLVRTYRPNLNNTNMVTNIKKVCFDNAVEFTDGIDHSKWAVSKTKGWICFGDLNREEKQVKRGGLSACLHDVQVAKEFKKLHERCQPVQPRKKETCSNSPARKKIQ